MMRVLIHPYLKSILFEHILVVRHAEGSRSQSSRSYSTQHPECLQNIRLRLQPLTDTTREQTGLAKTLEGHYNHILMFTTEGTLKREPPRKIVCWQSIAVVVLL